jgi:DNA-binding response OmpR family regulator
MKDLNKNVHGDIIVVEDNKSDLKFLSEILTKAGYQVRAASDGELALLSIQVKLPDLILLDINLPGMKGIEVCSSLKNDIKTRDIPVIFSSALGETELKVKALEAGGIDYITKPLQPAEVLARIDTHLNIYRLQQELKTKSEKLLMEIEERKKAEQALKETRDMLEIRVRERTSDLFKTNEALQFEIVERKNAEKEIKRQLLEKEVILKEVHHRIKNNIQSIENLLTMQAQSITNPEALSALQNAIGRVDSVKILYEKLLLTNTYRATSVKEYLNNLIDQIIKLFPDNLKLTVIKEIADFKLEPKRMVSLGMIVNELLTDAMKYAFAGKTEGTLHIKLVDSQKIITLTIQDD